MVKRLIYILLTILTAILNCSDLSGMPRGSLRIPSFLLLQLLMKRKARKVVTVTVTV